MNDAYSILGGIVANAIKNNPPADGDYYGADGLLYCGKCHTPKQTIGKGFLDGKHLPIPCLCKQKEDADEEAREKRRKADELRKEFLPREQMRSCRFENAEASPQIKYAQTYADNWDKLSADGSGLLFWGNTGTGKSYAALCIANALIDRRVPVRYYSAVDLVTDLMDKEKHDSILKTVSEIPLLILDDIGAERNTEYSREQICRIVDARIESGKPLVCTTNYSMGEMEKATDKETARLFDRLLSVCMPIKVEGESRRRAIGKAKLEEFRKMIAG